MRDDASYFRRFAILKALWAMVRGGSVIWSCDLTDDVLTTTGRNGPHTVIIHNMTIHGKPLTLEQLCDDSMECGHAAV